MQPREKMAAAGADALSDRELLTLLLGTGSASMPVEALADELLDAFGGFRGLLAADRKRLMRVPGVGPAKTGKLLAVRELSRRYLTGALWRG